MVIGALVAAGMSAAFAIAGVGQPCDNGANAAGCTFPGTSVTVPGEAPVYGGQQVGISPINVGGDASCSGENTCGDFGTGPVAVGGNATCSIEGNYASGCGAFGTGPVAVGGNATCSHDGVQTTGCGAEGAGPVAVGGNASCSADNGCGGGVGSAGPVAVGGNASCSARYGCGAPLGTGPVAVGGNASCSAQQGCGFLGMGPVAVGGNASCSADEGCGFLGMGPIATGDVSCSGTCGGPGDVPFVGVPLPRTGTPGIAVIGHAYCDQAFDPAQATNVTHLETFQCVSVADTATNP